MSAADKNFEKVVSLAQEQITEPVRAAAVFQRKGSFSSQLWGAAGARGTSLSIWSASKKAAKDFPAQTLLALTDQGLYAFEAKGGFSWKIKDRVGAWAIGDFRATVAEAKMVATLRLDLGEGTGAELETMTSMANARNIEIIRLLAALPS
jgi:hypothetical protein